MNNIDQIFGELRRYKVYVSGMHCASCQILIDDILSEFKFIKNSNIDLDNEIIEIEMDKTKNIEDVLEILNSKLKSNGYNFSLEKKIKEDKNNDILWKAIPIGLVFLVLFILLQKSGILNFGINGEITPITSFIIGLVASVSSCLIIVGGLVLSLSTEEAKNAKGSINNPLILFHSGRLIGFAIFGGILGILGRVIGVNFIFSAILGLLTSVIMFFLGLNLLGIFEKNKFTLPSNIFYFFRKIEHATITPIIIGLGTFFLPCGFTQSMQVAALSSGSFEAGLLIMLFFSLGTLPVLSLLSFGVVPFAHSKHAPLFFKSAGVVIVGFGLISFLASITSLGIISPLFNF